MESPNNDSKPDTLDTFPTIQTPPTASPPPAESVKDLAMKACETKPEPLPVIYNFVQGWRPGTANETIRARLYEAMKDGKVERIMEGVYFARRGEAQLLVVEGDAWEVLGKLDDDSIDMMISDIPGKLGRNWAGQGTTRPHAAAFTGGDGTGGIGGRTYHQPELDEEFFKQAFRVLKQEKDWRRGNGLPGTVKGGATCLIRSPIETWTTHEAVQHLIKLAESVGFVYYTEMIIALDSIGMGYTGRDLGAKWLVFTKGEHVGVPWDLTVPNVIQAHRVKNPAKKDFTKHEAEKDAIEFIEPIKMYSRSGDVILDTFAGVAKWRKDAMEMGRHVILCDMEKRWVDSIAADAGYSFSTSAS
jgi:DNA methylase